MLKKFRKEKKDGKVIEHWSDIHLQFSLHKKDKELIYFEIHFHGKKDYYVTWDNGTFTHGHVISGDEDPRKNLSEIVDTTSESDLNSFIQIFKEEAVKLKKKDYQEILEILERQGK